MCMYVCVCVYICICSYLNAICFVPDPPTITEFAEVDPIRVGENLDLLCTATGVPTPILTIYNDGEFVASLPGGYLTHTITSASSRDDHGMYNCTAHSTSKATGQPLPVASKTIQVIVEG